MINTNKVITGPKTLWTNMHVWNPMTFFGESEPRYSICLCISKDDKETINKINLAIQAAYEDGKSKLKTDSGNIPPISSLKMPFTQDDSEYHVYASSRMAPGIVDYKVEPITDPSLVYNGCYGRASISFYVYNYGMHKGIGCTLNNLQKLEDGTPLAVTE